MKNSNELDLLLNVIQSKTNKTLADIAKSIDRSDAHLSRLRTGPVEKINKTVMLLKEKYADVLKDRLLDAGKFTDSQKITYFESAIEVLMAEIASLRAAANHSVFQEELLQLHASVEHTIKRHRDLLLERLKK